MLASPNSIRRYLNGYPVIPVFHLLCKPERGACLCGSSGRHRRPPNPPEKQFPAPGAWPSARGDWQRPHAFQICPEAKVRPRENVTLTTVGYCDMIRCQLATTLTIGTDRRMRREHRRRRLQAARPQVDVGAD